MENSERKCIFLAVFLTFIICAAGAFLGGLITMLLWNYVVCTIFVSCSAISYWVAVGVWFLLFFVSSFFKVIVKKEE